MSIDELEQRAQSAVDNILENEQLTAGLDDAAAQSLLEWGIACAEMIARSTADLTDAEAENTIYPRLRATRKMMRRVNRWSVNQPMLDSKASAERLAEILEQAAIVYGDEYVPASQDQQVDFLRSDSPNPVGPQLFITSVRNFIERAGAQATTDAGGSNDQAFLDQETQP
jgi:hypothetical protein